MTYAALLLLFLPKKDKMFTIQPLVYSLITTDDDDDDDDPPVWGQDCRLMTSVLRTMHCGQHHAAATLQTFYLQDEHHKWNIQTA